MFKRLLLVLVASCAGSKATEPIRPTEPMIVATDPNAPPPETKQPEQVALGEELRSDPCDGGEATGGIGMSGSAPGGGGASVGGSIGGAGAIGGGGTGPGYGNQKSASGASVKFGDQSVTGDLDKALVRRVVRANLPKIRYCYEKVLAKNPGLGGSLIATFTIELDGSVVTASAAGVHPDVEACIVRAVKSFKFPAHASPATVHYPFTFSGQP